MATAQYQWSCRKLKRPINFRNEAARQEVLVHPLRTILSSTLRKQESSKSSVVSETSAKDKELQKSKAKLKSSVDSGKQVTAAFVDPLGMLTLFLGFTLETSTFN